MSFAYMPFYTGDYLRDTRHLSPMKHGVYILALTHCWDSRGPMPLDEQECSGICNCRSADEVDALRYILDRYFVRMDDGHYNKRIAEEVARCERLSKTFSDAGLRSAEVRREKARAGSREKIEAKTTKAEGRFNLGSTKAEGRSVSPSPSPALAKEEEKTNTPRKRGAAGRLVSVDDLIAEGVDAQSATDWLTNRKVKDLPLTPTALKVVKAEALKAGMSLPEAIRTAAGNSWGGFRASWLDKQAPVDKFAGAV